MRSHHKTQSGLYKIKTKDNKIDHIISFAVALIEKLREWFICDATISHANLECDCANKYVYVCLLVQNVLLLLHTCFMANNDEASKLLR